ncbi:hypothetical protein ABAC460_03310 [Asticcacaulis sp. AC460]|uniref:hypothetical protein n=1 Tax=Asticcacaulis sp. AC460 TaxID=1282360 RepID=UPI0003C3B528|nr:hypothetical protein [Asticcacaulis sp. AC460]ESQ91939.1 hypothetical protein ABAC460_03310 [Asticcacaulis sp. AC460]
MDRRKLGAGMAAILLAACAGSALADDRLPAGAYVLTYDGQAIAIELGEQGEARVFVVEVEEVATPLKVALTFDGKGGVSGSGPFSGGVWTWSGTFDGQKISGTTTFTYRSASTAAAFEIFPRNQYGKALGLGQGGRKAKAPRSRKA